MRGERKLTKCGGKFGGGGGGGGGGGREKLIEGKK